MEYKVIPFVPSIDARKGNPKDVAAQLENLIEVMQEKGWAYIRLESVSTFVEPESGCFGMSGKPGYTTSTQLAVFSKESVF